MHLNYLANIGRYIPEVILVLLMVGLIILEATYKEDEKNRKYIFIATLVGLVATLGALIANMSGKAEAIFSNSIIIDQFSTLIKMVMVLGTLAAIYLSRFSKDIYESLKTEFAIMAVGILIGGFLLASANNMLTFYLGIETLSILSYVMAALKKNDQRSSEAGLKYALYGGISAGLMLFGMSHIFGVLGTIQFAGVAKMIPTLTSAQLAILMPSFVLLFAGIGYKIASVPFHMWSPDVYEGSPTPVTTFFAIVPKLAGIAALIRITAVFFVVDSPMKIGWIGLLIVISALTMTVGNVTAIGQKSVKRMLAYSSISHAGIMLAGIVVINDVGIRSVVFYGITYLFMTLVAFYITSIVQDKYGNDHFDRFSGLIYRYPFMAVMMAVVMFSLTGLPPLAGFVAKYNIISSLINSKNYALAIVLGLNSVVSAYYYLKIVRLMTLKPQESNEEIEGFGFLNQMVIVSMTVPVFVLGIFWETIMNLAAGAKLFIQ
ncbi:MAG: NADH-quinone oxidoreductase subunit N [Bacteriovoracaceae bacterium]|nr:NADH-quinone oxidoreductase subunit N [Bacteriovoracaceae bacterium]